MELGLIFVYLVVFALVGYCLNLHNLLFKKPLQKSAGRIISEDILNDGNITKVCLKNSETPWTPKRVIDNGETVSIFKENLAGAITPEGTYRYDQFLISNARDVFNKTNDGVFILKFNDDPYYQSLVSENASLKLKIQTLNKTLTDISKDSKTYRFEEAKAIGNENVQRNRGLVSSWSNYNKPQQPIQNKDDQDIGEGT